MCTIRVAVLQGATLDCLSLGAPAHESTSRPARRTVASSAASLVGLTQPLPKLRRSVRGSRATPPIVGEYVTVYGAVPPAKRPVSCRASGAGAGWGWPRRGPARGVPTTSRSAPRRLGPACTACTPPRRRSSTRSGRRESPTRCGSIGVRPSLAMGIVAAPVGSDQLSATPRSRSSLRRESPRSVRPVPVPSSRCSVETAAVGRRLPRDDRAPPGAIASRCSRDPPARRRPSVR